MTPVAVVAAGHRESARAGAEILARGGNAVDAVCATACAAAVAEAPLTGPGAGGFLLARSPDGVATLLDFFVAVPGLGPDGRRLDPATLDAFTVPFGDAEQVFHIGASSVAVPGMIPGIATAITRLGRLALSDVVTPAIRLAVDGVVVTPEAAYLYEILEAMLTHTPEAAAIFAPVVDSCAPAIASFSRISRPRSRRSPSRAPPSRGMDVWHETSPDSSRPLEAW